jgi:hypothetical protein
MYGKIFDSIYDGTLAEDWRALITFQQMIVLCDADGVIDMTPSAISRRTSIPIEHIKAGIEILENEDPYSRTKGNGGRRIIRLDEHRPWGWHIVNHEKYKNIKDAEEIRAGNRERKQRQREREREREKLEQEQQQSETGGICHSVVTQCHAMSYHTDTDTDTDTNTNTKDKGRKNSGPISIDTYLTNCKAQGVKAITPDDPVFDYAKDIKLSREFLYLCWREFVERARDNGKKYKSWPQAFRNAVRGNWYKLWYASPEGEITLTSQGIIAQKKHKGKADD